MGCKELIDSLRENGKSRIRGLQEEAERDVQRIRDEAKSQIAAIREKHACDRRTAAARQAEIVFAAASARSRHIRIRSERTLAERLYLLARASLSSLRNVGYDDVFASFVLELPRLTWKNVRVHPADTKLARVHFPDADVVEDAGIAGGFEVGSEDDLVRIANTFDKRLERRWDELLPGIMKDVKELCR